MVGGKGGSGELVWGNGNVVAREVRWSQRHEMRRDSDCMTAMDADLLYGFQSRGWHSETEKRINRKRRGLRGSGGREYDWGKRKKRKQRRRREEKNENVKVDDDEGRLK